MATKIKLTPAQHKLLTEQKGQFVDSYKPGLKLKELGLIECRASGFYLKWEITEAGKAYLVAS